MEVPAGQAEQAENGMEVLPRDEGDVLGGSNPGMAVEVPLEEPPAGGLPHLTVEVPCTPSGAHPPGRRPPPKQFASPKKGLMRMVSRKESMKGKLRKALAPYLAASYWQGEVAKRFTEEYIANNPPPEDEGDLPAYVQNHLRELTRVTERYSGCLVSALDPLNHSLAIENMLRRRREIEEGVCVDPGPVYTLRGKEITVDDGGERAARRLAAAEQEAALSEQQLASALQVVSDITVWEEILAARAAEERRQHAMAELHLQHAARIIQRSYRKWVDQKREEKERLDKLVSPDVQVMLSAAAYKAMRDARNKVELAKLRRSLSRRAKGFGSAAPRDLGPAVRQRGAPPHAPAGPHEERRRSREVHEEGSGTHRSGLDSAGEVSGALSRCVSGRQRGVVRASSIVARSTNILKRLVSFKGPAPEGEAAGPSPLDDERYAPVMGPPEELEQLGAEGEEEEQEGEEEEWREGQEGEGVEGEGEEGEEGEAAEYVEATTAPFHLGRGALEEEAAETGAGAGAGGAGDGEAAQAGGGAGAEEGEEGDSDSAVSGEDAEAAALELEEVAEMAAEIAAAMEEEEGEEEGHAEGEAAAGAAGAEEAEGGSGPCAGDDAAQAAPAAGEAAQEAEAGSRGAAVAGPGARPPSAAAASAAGSTSLRRRAGGAAAPQDEEAALRHAIAGALAAAAAPLLGRDGAMAMARLGLLEGEGAGAGQAGGAALFHGMGAGGAAGPTARQARVSRITKPAPVRGRLPHAPAGGRPAPLRPGGGLQGFRPGPGAVPFGVRSVAAASCTGQQPQQQPGHGAHGGAAGRGAPEAAAPGPPPAPPPAMLSVVRIRKPAPPAGPWPQVPGQPRAADQPAPGAAQPGSGALPPGGATGDMAAPGSPSPITRTTPAEVRALAAACLAQSGPEADPLSPGATRAASVTSPTKGPASSPGRAAHPRGPPAGPGPLQPAGAGDMAPGSVVQLLPARTSVGDWAGSGPGAAAGSGQQGRGPVDRNSGGGHVGSSVSGAALGAGAGPGVATGGGLCCPQAGAPRTSAASGAQEGGRASPTGLLPRPGTPQQQAAAAAAACGPSPPQAALQPTDSGGVQLPALGGAGSRAAADCSPRNQSGAQQPALLPAGGPGPQQPQGAAGDACGAAEPGSAQAWAHGAPRSGEEDAECAATAAACGEQEGPAAAEASPQGRSALPGVGAASATSPAGAAGAAAYAGPGPGPDRPGTPSGPTGRMPWAAPRGRQPGGAAAVQPGGGEASSPGRGPSELQLPPILNSPNRSFTGPTSLGSPSPNPNGAPLPAALAAAAGCGPGSPLLSLRAHGPGPHGALGQPVLRTSSDPHMQRPPGVLLSVKGLHSPGVGRGPLGARDAAARAAAGQSLAAAAAEGRARRSSLVGSSLEVLTVTGLGSPGPGGGSPARQRPSLSGTLGPLFMSVEAAGGMQGLIINGVQNQVAPGSPAKHVGPHGGPVVVMPALVGGGGGAGGAAAAWRTSQQVAAGGRGCEAGLAAGAQRASVPGCHVALGAVALAQGPL